MTQFIDTATARQRAESLMTSTCTIREPSAGTTMDPQTGAVIASPGTVVYAGPCRVRPAVGVSGGKSTVQDVAGDRVLSFDYLVSVPFSASGVKERQRVTIDSSLDASLVGVDVEIHHVARGDTISARRLQCREVA